MELTIKMATVLMLSIVSFGGVMRGFQVWRDQSASSMREHAQVYPEKIQTINKEVLGKAFPIIEASDIYIRQNATFQAMDHVSANDPNAGDITQRVQAYGTVDTSLKGEYEIRYVVRNDFGLKTTKYMKVIVD